jgi:hypothetical protein
MAAAKKSAQQRTSVHLNPEGRSDCFQGILVETLFAARSKKPHPSQKP